MDGVSAIITSRHHFFNMYWDSSAFFFPRGTVVLVLYHILFLVIWLIIIYNLRRMIGVPSNYSFFLRGVGAATSIAATALKQSFQ